ncbi:MAG: YdeI/OmpD-associated family protein [Chitinophagales bacterium]
MANSTAQKLKIKEGFSLLTINAPAEFKKNIGDLPAGVKISAGAKNCNQVHWFVMNKTQMDKELYKVLKLVKDDVILWIYYPKGTSKIQTDLTRDKGWDSLLKHDELTWISLISFDDTWSTFGSRLKTNADKKREKKPKERPIFDYVDPKTKTVRLPDNLATAFKENKKPEEFFNSLSFTNKKEYIEWIITAKREETRNERVNGTVERLGKGWKNPNNL